MVLQKIPDTIKNEVIKYEFFENGYEFKILSERYISAICQLINKSYEDTKNKHIFSIPNYREVKRRLNGGGITIGAFWDCELIGIRMISFSKSIKKLKKKFECDISRVGKMELICVAANHRRRKIAQCLNKIALSIFSIHECKLAFATASPYNLSSILCLFKSDFKILDLNFMYEGVLRYWFIHRFDKNLLNNIHKTRILKNFDIDGQKILLNDGYIGHGISLINENDLDIIYMK